MAHYSEAVQAEDKQKAERKRLEEEHFIRLKAREEDKQRALETAEQAKRDKQKAAEDKQKRLEEMKEKWVTLPPQTATSSKKDKKGVASTDVVDSDDEDDGLAFLNNLSDNKEKVTAEEADLFGDDEEDAKDESGFKAETDEDDIFGDVVAVKKRKLVNDEDEDGDGDSGSKRSKTDE